MGPTVGKAKASCSLFALGPQISTILMDFWP